MITPNIEQRFLVSDFLISEPVTLEPTGSWPKSHHYPDNESGYALVAAEATGRPLLVRGEPGGGKSQLARFAAKQMDRQLISTVINASTQAQDLLWQMDDLARLATAQLMAAADDAEDAEARMEAKHFIRPGPLWWAYNYPSAWAQQQQFNQRINSQANSEPPVEENEQGYVLLIDEIDKADRDLPNSLLEALGNDDFTVEPLGTTIRHDADNPAPKPLVVITSNNERELPPAFVRRCVVLDINIPDDEATAFVDYLLPRGKCHFGELTESIRRKAAEQLYTQRMNCKPDQPYAGQAEYLDMLRALHALGTPTDEVKLANRLTKLERYLFNKAEPSS